MAYIPPRPETDKAFFSVMSWIIFISGFNYNLVDERWPRIKRAFHHFDVNRIAGTTTEDYLDKSGMIKNRNKIDAIIKNAGICADIIKEHGSLMKWVSAVRKKHQKEPFFTKSVQEEMMRFHKIGKTTSRWMAYVTTRDESLLQDTEAERRRHTITK